MLKQESKTEINQKLMNALGCADDFQIFFFVTVRR